MNRVEDFSLCPHLMKPDEAKGLDKRGAARESGTLAARPLVPPTPTQKLPRGESLAWEGGSLRRRPLLPFFR